MKEVLCIKIEGIISSFDLDFYTSFYFKTDLILSIKKNVVFTIITDVLDFLLTPKRLLETLRN